MLETLIIPDEENPLLRKSIDRKTTFASDSDREFSAARYFAEEINSGRMKVEQAYDEFWSRNISRKWTKAGLLEDKEYRITKKEIRGVIGLSASILSEELQSELLGCITKSYFDIPDVNKINAEDSARYEADILEGTALRKITRFPSYYNQFIDELCFACELIGLTGLDSEICTTIVEGAINYVRYSGNPNSTLISNLLHSIGQSDRQEAFSFLADPLNYCDSIRSIPYINALKDIKDGRGAELLFQYAKDARLAKNVLSILADISLERAIPIFRHFAFMDEETELSHEILFCLRELDDERATQILIDYIFDPSRTYTSFALRCLGSMKSDASTEALLRYLSNPDNPHLWDAYEGIDSVKRDEYMAKASPVEKQKLMKSIDIAINEPPPF